MRNILNKIKRTKRYGIYLLTVVVFILVNLLVSSYSARLDVSYGGAYTLSAATKKIVKNLDNIVTLKFFVSSDLPTRLLPLKNEVVDLLNEYQKENPGKVTVKVADPQKDQSAQTEAKELGIPALQFSQLEQDKYAVTSSYLGVVISYGGKNQILPQVTDIDSLEYNLTAAIFKLTSKQDIKIAIMGPADQTTNLERVLRQQFAVDYIDVSTNSAAKNIDPGYKTVLVFDNGQEFDAQTITALKKYLDGNGHAVFFADGIWVAENLSTAPANNNLDVVLDKYGIKINNDLILSGNAEIVNFGTSQMSFLVPYPFWVKTGVFNLKTPFFSNINQVMFPWPSSIRLETRPDTETAQLIQTNKKSWEQSKDFNLDPQSIPQPQTQDLKQYTLAAYSKKNNQGEIIVIASSRFVLDRYLNQLSNNLEFVLNAVNNFTSGGALSGIRQRAVSFYPLPEVSANEKDIFKYVNILLLPGLFALAGAWHLVRRK